MKNNFKIVKKKLAQLQKTAYLCVIINTSITDSILNVMQKQPTEYFANNGQVYICTIGSTFAVRDIESQQLYTIVPKTNNEAKKEASKFEMEALLKSMDYNVKAFTDYLVSGEYTSNRKNMRVSIYNRY